MAIEARGPEPEPESRPVPMEVPDLFAMQDGDRPPVASSIKDDIEVSRSAGAALDAKLSSHGVETSRQPESITTTVETSRESGEVLDSILKEHSTDGPAAPSEKPKLYDQDADKEKIPGAIPTSRVTIRAQRAAERAAEENARKLEADAARTRINDVDLAHGMAIIADKGYDKAREKTEKAAKKADKITTTAEASAKTAERSARTYRSRHHNEEAAALREQDAATARTEAASEAARIKQEAQEKGEAALAKAWTKAEAYKDAEVEKLSTQRTDDDQVAWDAALAEKGPREQAMVIEKGIDEGIKEGKLTQAERDSREKLAADLRIDGTKAAETAQEASEKKRDDDNNSINEQIIKTSRQINGIVGATEPQAAHPIGVNDQITPEMLAKFATELESSLKVDFEKAPLDSVDTGALLFGQKFTDTYRQSDEPRMRGVVFVERTDRKTGQLVRLDVVAAPRPDKPTPKPGKFKVGFLANRMYQRKEKQWRAAIDEQLLTERHIPRNPSKENPFYPGDPKNAQKMPPGTTAADSYPAMLQRRGMSPEAAKTVRKPRRLWFGLFG